MVLCGLINIEWKALRARRDASACTRVGVSVNSPKASNLAISARFSCKNEIFPTHSRCMTPTGTRGYTIIPRDSINQKTLQCYYYINKLNKKTFIKSKKKKKSAYFLTCIIILIWPREKWAVDDSTKKQPKCGYHTRAFFHYYFATSIALSSVYYIV